MQRDASPLTGADASASLVSVIMPVYNARSFLKESIESVLAQTYADFELVIVDDASGDGSWDIIQSYAKRDPRLVPCRNISNMGHRAATNRAHALARGEFLARNDHDDVSLPFRLALQVAYMQRNPGVGVLGTAYISESEGGRRVTRVPALEDTVLRWQLLFGMQFCHSTLMFRRSLFSHSDIRFRYAPAAYDYEICARLARTARCGCIASPCVIYKPSAQGMSARQQNAMNLSARAISNREIRRVLGNRAVPGEALDDLRRLSRFGVCADYQRSAGLLFSLMRCFAAKRHVEPRSMKKVRRSWFRRYLSAAHFEKGRSGETWQTFTMVFATDRIGSLRVLVAVFMKSMLARMKPASSSGGSCAR